MPEWLAEIARLVGRLLVTALVGTGVEKLFRARLQSPQRALVAVGVLCAGLASLLSMALQLNGWESFAMSSLAAGVFALRLGRWNRHLVLTGLGIATALEALIVFEVWWRIVSAVNDIATRLLQHTYYNDAVKGWLLLGLVVATGFGAWQLLRSRIGDVWRAALVVGVATAVLTRFAPGATTWDSLTLGLQLGGSLLAFAEGLDKRLHLSRRGWSALIAGIALTAVLQRMLWEANIGRAHAIAERVLAVSYYDEAVMGWVIIVLPLVLGFGLGRLARRRVSTHALLIALVLWFVVAGSLLRLVRVGLWDSLTIGLELAVGYLAAQPRLEQPLARRRAAMVLVTSLLGLAGAELAVRFALPVLPVYYLSSPSHIVVPRFDLDHFAQTESRFTTHVAMRDCCALFPNQCVDTFAEATWRPTPVSRAVLHVGDSMTEGTGLLLNEKPFPALLEEQNPALTQINAGVSGTSPDYYALLARHWLPKLPVKLVVMHVFTGNDIDMMGSPYRCCADGPLLDDATPMPQERCPQPRWPAGFGESFDWFLGHSPPPALVREFTSFSRLARYLVAEIVGIQERHDARVKWPSLLEYRSREDPGWKEAPAQLEPQWALFEHTLTGLRDELRAQGIPLVVSVLPLRQALEYREPRATEAYAFRTRILAICRRLGVRALDPWDVLEQTVHVQGGDAVFIPEGNVHFNQAGHRLYAAWLAEQLRPDFEAILGSSLSARQTSTAR